MEVHKIARLTRANVEALKLVRQRGILAEGESLDLTLTTATFTMDKPVEWLTELHDQLGREFGKTQHPYHSLHSVVRKLRQAVNGRYFTIKPESKDEGPEALTSLLKLD